MKKQQNDANIVLEINSLFQKSLHYHHLKQCFSLSNNCISKQISCFSVILSEIKCIDSKQQRQTGRQAQLSNISAARAVSDIIRTTLGPRSMLKVRSNVRLNT